MDNPYILLYDKKISNLKEFLPILQPAAESGRPLYGDDAVSGRYSDDAGLYW